MTSPPSTDTNLSGNGTVHVGDELAATVAYHIVARRQYVREFGELIEVPGRACGWLRVLDGTLSLRDEGHVLVLEDGRRLPFLLGPDGSAAATRSTAV